MTERRKTWKPIKTAPKKPLDKNRYGPKFFAFNTHGHCFAFWDEDFGRWFIEDAYDDHQQPTHWMRLPAAPR